MNTATDKDARFRHDIKAAKSGHVQIPDAAAGPGIYLAYDWNSKSYALVSAVSGCITSGTPKFIRGAVTGMYPSS